MISGARSDDFASSARVYRPNVGPERDAFPTWSVIPALFGTRSLPELDPSAAWSVNLVFERVRHRPEPVRWVSSAGDRVRVRRVPLRPGDDPREQLEAVDETGPGRTTWASASRVN
jgi:hypothetical protein